MEIQYVGEHLLAGLLGRIFIYAAFFAAILAFILYYQSVKTQDESKRKSLKKTARLLFIVHTASLAGAAAVMLHMLYYHYFEYQYVWQYSSRDLPLQYIISSFWAGQEGSFLIWTMLQSFIGLVLLFTAREWERHVMAIYSVAQALLTSTILGLNLGFIKIGQSPFLLLRETVDTVKDSIFENADYVSQLVDGNGLNPLLENYWMVTHPPALFLGYASVLVPFCFAVAGLWSKKYSEWIKPALPWTSFAVLALGVGIILGGLWAYVSLTFGGFWAWDPVENASLVPWLIIVAALHFMLIARKQKNALLFSVIFTPLAYFLVIYATYLTRSGVLGETSAHSFGANGMILQLYIILATFFLIPAILIIKNYRHLKSNFTENTWTREFWMFAGALILVLSAFQIIFVTSIPVWNGIFGSNFAPPLNVVAFYNKWQLPFTFLVLIFIGAASYLWYKSNDLRVFSKRISIAAIIALVITIILSFSILSKGFYYSIFVFASVFAAVVSVDLMISMLKKFVNPAGMLTHLGFAIFITGTIITFSNSTTISKNTSGMNLGNRKANSENQVLILNDTVAMGSYFVAYSSKETKGRESFYTLEFFNKNNSGYKKEFEVTPSVNRNERMGYVYNPSTKRLFLRDIYTFISYADASSTSTPLIENAEISKGDTIPVRMSYLIFDSISLESSNSQPDPDNISIVSHFQLVDRNVGLTYYCKPTYKVLNREVTQIDGQMADKKYRVRFEKISDTPGNIFISVFEEKVDYIVVKAVINPYINLIWLGCILTFTGLIIAIIKRRKK
ncbi:MAG: cytochrome c biogenesis protein CcsA [Bacteroidales bacterium]|nr:cytochrome c biogenesis protein CcsA [Bacteroidales bacterium]